MALSVLECFAGIGGMSLGLERAGFTVVGQVEINPYCRQVLARHWPEVPRHDDITTAVAWWLSVDRPEVDLVAGGYPCQGESLAGRRLGTDDDRWLWPDMARLIHAVQPRAVLTENVVGHRTRGLRFVLRDLERLGYTTYPGIVSASEMGAPHRRQRIFTMAYADGRSGRSETRQPVTATGHPTAGLGPAEPGRRCSSGPVMANTNSQPGRPWRTGDTEQSAQGRDASRSGGGPAMANPDRDWEQQPSGRERHEWRRTSDGGKARRSMADTGSAGRVAGRGGSAVPGSTSGTGRHSGAHLAGHAWWATEPDVDRVAYGVPGRVDRLRALGNAVVPHCAQFIGEILAAELGSPTTTSQGGQDGH